MAVKSAGTVVATAASYKGTRYVFGGSSKKGIDCSGLTQKSWAAGGVSLPHSAALQQAQTKKRPLARAQPGDIIFIGNPAHHCGIFIGNGQMIDAQQTGVPVQVHSIQQRGLQQQVGAFPGSSVAPSSSAGGGSTEQSIFEFLTGTLGLSGAQAAGALGNLQVESNFNTGASNAREGAIGLAQWEGGRRTKLKAYAASRGGKETDLAVQLGFMAQELQGAYKGVFARLRKATTPAEAATIWDAQYEVSSGAARGDRIKNAQSIYQQIQSGKALTGGGAAQGTSDAMLTSINPLDAVGEGVDAIVGPIVTVLIKVAFTGLGLVMIALGGAATVKQTANGVLQ